MTKAETAAGRTITIETIAAETAAVRQIASEKTRSIQAITGKVQMLALNAMIEAARAGDAGRGFSVVAHEVRQIGERVEEIAGSLESELSGRIADLQGLVERLSETAQDERMIDLALNAIELMDRNLYERTCDVRWWATDSDVVHGAAEPNSARLATVTERLGVILSAYTVYLDLWLCDTNGIVLANGRPDRHPGVVGSSVVHKPWFQQARMLPDGDTYVAADVEREDLLGHGQVATYCASVRTGGRSDGQPLGVLAINFDWEPQARAIVEGVRVAPADKARTRVLLVDAKKRVLAASDGAGLLTEQLALPTGPAACGSRRDPHAGTLTAFQRTPGYETYKGLGWWGVIVQQTARAR